jgi:glutathione S-transferase
MAMTLVIGTKRYSSWSLRPWIAMKVAGIPFDEVTVALRQPDTKAEILKHSPSGKVPLLIHDGFKVWETIAILDYLADLFPDACLWPADIQARALARAAAAEMHAGFVPIRRDCPMDVLADTPMAEVPAEVMGDLARIESLWADCRARFGGGGPFLFGHFTNADAMFAPVVTRIRTYHLPVSPETAAYCDAVMALPAMAEWVRGAAL